MLDVCEVGRCLLRLGEVGRIWEGFVGIGWVRLVEVEKGVGAGQDTKLG